MRAAFIASSLAVLAFAACGRHDTPLAAYLAPQASPSGNGGNLAADAGSAGGGGEAGAPPNPLVCPESYAIAVDGLTSRYRQATTGHGWVEAERDCESDGGHLIVVDSEAENAFVASIAEKTITNITSTHQLSWLGAGDSTTEGEFRWVTGIAFTSTSTFWSGAGGADGEQEPNSLYDDEDCVEIRANGQWNDDRCNAELTYVCECDGAASAAEWCDSSLATSCGDCDTACPSGQSCVKQQCQ